MRERFKDPKVIDLAEKRREREPQTATEIAVAILERSRAHRDEMLQEFAEEYTKEELSKEEMNILFKQEYDRYVLSLTDATLETLAQMLRDGVSAHPMNHPALIAAAERYLDFAIKP